MSRKTYLEKTQAAVDADMQLVDGPTLLQRLFPENCRPTHRWLQHMVKRRAITSLKCGHLRFYCPTVVRAELEAKSIRARGVKGL